MTIYDLAAFRKKKTVKNLLPKIIKNVPVSISEEQHKAIQELTERWNQYSLQNKINKLFCNDLKIEIFNYLESLTHIVELERKLQIRMAVMPSDFINFNDESAESSGRAAVFKYGLVVISTPLFPLEEEARMFAILLHQKLNIL